MKFVKIAVRQSTIAAVARAIDRSTLVNYNGAEFDKPLSQMNYAVHRRDTFRGTTVLLILIGTRSNNDDISRGLNSLLLIQFPSVALCYRLPLHIQFFQFKRENFWLRTKEDDSSSAKVLEWSKI